MQAEHGPPPQYTTAPPTRQGTQPQIDNGRPTASQQDPLPAERSGGWFSGLGSKKKQQDVERGDGIRRQDAPLPNIPNDARREQAALQKNRY
jgi:hypothetical protein